MLWYKAWRESRTRFLLIVLFMVALCVYRVLEQTTVRTSAPVLISYTAYVYKYLYATLGLYFLELFLPLLSMGGLLRERGRGTAALSLSLPVSRSRLVGARATVGLLEIVALALVPAILIPTLSPLVGESYPVSVALHFGLLWIVCGSAIFAMSFLFSAVFANEFTALVVSCIAIFFYVLITSMEARPSLQPNNMWRFSIPLIFSGIGGPGAVVRMVAGIPDPLPWTALFVIAMVTLALLAIATRISEQQDF